MKEAQREAIASDIITVPQNVRYSVLYAHAVFQALFCPRATGGPPIQSIQNRTPNERSIK